MALTHSRLKIMYIWAQVLLKGHLVPKQTVEEPLKIKQ